MKGNQEKYNASDFARYHSGTMPPDEMHALEKAALEDPFLADALDGYAFSKKPEKELDEIRMRLDKKRKQQKVFSISSLSSGIWWKIVAMFIVIAGAGYFFFFINSQKEKALSVKENFAKKEKAEIISRIKGDTAATEADIAFEKPSTKKNKTNRSKLSVPAAKSVQIPSVKNIEEKKEIKEEKDLSEEHLAVKNGKLIMMSNGKERQADMAVTDSGQKSFLQSSDTTALVAVTPGLLSHRDSDNTIAMNQKNAALNEVVIVGYGTQKKKSMTGAVSERLEGKASGVDVSTASPYPKEGKEKFDQYIKENTTSISDADGKKLTADILLSFALNKKGSPVDIKVLESSCKPCEDEAIRLLKKGPKWVGKPGAKGTVRIKF